jgi:MYXO-CTERM domain-containing protein
LVAATQYLWLAMTARVRRSFAGAAVLIALGACSRSSPAPAEETKQAIFGGQDATECQWPTTVFIDGCTGTLVHPLIVTTAAHCGTNHRTVIFGESGKAPARRVAIDYCRAYTATPGVPQAATLRDWAFCKLKQPVTDVPIIPILMGCETDVLAAGQKVVVAGFGANINDNGMGLNDGFGTKRFVETTIVRVDTGRGIQVGGMGKAPCYGDSGGPGFVKLADRSWRVFAIDSAGLAATCDAGDLMTLIHKGVAWMEQESGIDITPCHDADGTWNPSPACGGFSLGPEAPGRSWSTGCAEPTLSPPSATCGPAAGAPDAAPLDTGVPADAAPAPPVDAAAASGEDTAAAVPVGPAPLPPDGSSAHPVAADAAAPAPHQRGGCAVAGEGSPSGWWWLLALVAAVTRARSCGRPSWPRTAARRRA